MVEYDAQLALRQSIARILDQPSLYMGGPSKQNLRRADEIISHLRSDARLIDALRSAPTVSGDVVSAKRTTS